MDRGLDIGGKERSAGSQLFGVSVARFYFSAIIVCLIKYVRFIYRSSAANKAIGGGEPRDQLDLIVAAQEIAACTAQLVVSSRVKAPRGSVLLSELGQASRQVTQATGGVVATVKDSQRRLDDQQDQLDLSTMSVHQAKTLEMEIQVKVLELEQALQQERLRLASFRRKNYRES